MKDYLPALTAFCGVVIGAVLQFVLGRRTKREGVQLDQKVSAYVDYFKHRMALGTDDSPKAYADLLGSQARVALYASPRVLRAFADFERAGGIAATEAQQDAFLQLLQAIRRDCGSGRALGADVLAVMLPIDDESATGKSTAGG